MKSSDKTCLNKIQSIPFHGIGLSVDLHVPDLFELILSLDHHSLAFDYLEIFRGPFSQIRPVREHFSPEFPLEYHADCLWFTQPDFHKSPWKKECDRTIEVTSCLKSDWITHECATKQIAGFPFGTYLPPLLTEESGRLIGRQSEEVRNYISTRSEQPGKEAPLFLVEVPPFYTFALGDIPLSYLFRTIAGESSCGFLLDIGHVYTYYLSTGLRESTPVEDFFETFLDEFPLERVVQIHLGGLKPFHQSYLDDHGERIPEILFCLLETALNHPGLIHLKGIALEVDTKKIDLILEEYQRFRSIGRQWIESAHVRP